MNCLLIFFTYFIQYIFNFSCSPLENHASLYRATVRSVDNRNSNQSGLACGIPLIYRLEIPTLQNLKESSLESSRMKRNAKIQVPKVHVISSWNNDTVNPTLKPKNKMGRVLTLSSLMKENGTKTFIPTILFSLARPKSLNQTRTYFPRTKGMINKTRDILLKFMSGHYINQTVQRSNNISSSRAITLVKDNHEKNEKVPLSSFITVPVKPLGPASENPQMVLDNHKTVNKGPINKLRPLTLMTTLKVSSPTSIPLVDYQRYTIKDAVDIGSKSLMVVDGYPGEVPNPVKIIHKKLIVADKSHTKETTPSPLPTTIVIPIMFNHPTPITASSSQKHPFYPESANHQTGSTGNTLSGGYNDNNFISSGPSYNIEQHVKYGTNIDKYGNAKPTNVYNHGSGYPGESTRPSENNYPSSSSSGGSYGSYGNNNYGSASYGQTTSTTYRPPYHSDYGTGSTRPPVNDFYDRPRPTTSRPGYGVYGSYGGYDPPPYRPPTTFRPYYRPTPGSYPSQGDVGRPPSDDQYPGFQTTTQGNPITTQFPNIDSSVFPIPRPPATATVFPVIQSTEDYTTTQAPPPQSTFIEVPAPTTTSRPGFVTLIETHLQDLPQKPTKKPPRRRPTPPKRRPPNRPYLRPTIRPRPTRPPAQFDDPPFADDLESSTIDPVLEEVTLPPSLTGSSSVFVPVPSTGGVMPLVSLTGSGVASFAGMTTMVRSILGALLIFLPSALVAAGILTSRRSSEPYMEMFPSPRSPVALYTRRMDNGVLLLPSVRCDSECQIHLVSQMTDTEPEFVRRMRDSPEMERLVASLHDLWTRLAKE